MELLKHLFTRDLKEAQYPTVSQVKKRIRDKSVRQQYTQDGYFYRWDLIQDFPLHEESAQLAGYKQFLTLVEKKREE